MIDTLKLIRSVLNIELKQSEKLTLIACIYKVNWRTWRADYPISIKSLQDEAGLSRSAVIRALNTLEGQYIKRTGTGKGGIQKASLLEVKPLSILGNIEGYQKDTTPCQKDTTPYQKDTTPCQKDTTPCQNETRIYPIYSKPIKSNEDKLDEHLEINSISKSSSLSEHRKRRELENDIWVIKRKGIIR